VGLNSLKSLNLTNVYPNNNKNKNNKKNNKVKSKPLEHRSRVKTRVALIELLDLIGIAVGNVGVPTCYYLCNRRQLTIFTICCILF
jgi:hypothetical protein